MSMYEESPEASGYDESLDLQELHEHAAQFATHVGREEIDTVWDYRVCRKRLNNYANRLFDAQQLQGEPVTVVLEGANASLIDFSTHNRRDAGDIASGYFRGYYVRAIPIDTEAHLAAVEGPEDLAVRSQSTELHSSAAWRDKNNPVEVELGMRLRPLIIPYDCDPEQTFIEVPIRSVKTMYEMYDNHPLMLDQAIFAAQAPRLLAQSEDVALSGEAKDARMAELVYWLEKNSTLGDYRMEIQFYDGCEYLTTDDLSSLRAFLANSDSAWQESPEVRTIIGNGLPEEVFLKGYDWLWTDEDDDGVEPLLYAVLELTDDDSIKAFGSNIITVPLEGIRFGICYPVGLHTDTAEECKRAFAYEESLFECVVDQLKGTKSEEDRRKAVENFLLFLADKGSTKTVGSTVAVRLNCDRQVAVWSDEDEAQYYPAVLPEWYEVQGDVCNYIIRDVGESDDDVQLELLVVLDVRTDPYFGSIDAARVEIPLSAVDGAAFVKNRNFN